MAPRSNNPIPRSYEKSEHTQQLSKDQNVESDYNIYVNPEQIKKEILSTSRTNTLISMCKWEQVAVCRERGALFRQQNAKARGEAAVGRLFQSKVNEHRERAVELEVLADLLCESFRSTRSMLTIKW